MSDDRRYGGQRNPHDEHRGHPPRHHDPYEDDPGTYTPYPRSRRGPVPSAYERPSEWDARRAAQLPPLPPSDYLNPTDERPPTLADRFEPVHRWLDARYPEEIEVTDAVALLRTICARFEAEADDSEQTMRALQLLRASVVGVLGVVRAPRPEPPPERQHPPEPPPRRSGLGRVISFGSGEKNEPDDRDYYEEPAPVPDPPVVDTRWLLTQVDAAFEAADRLVEAAEPPAPVRVRVPWSEDRELVDVLHGLLAAEAQWDGDLALHQIKQLRQSLALHHDIETVRLEPGNEQLFAVHVSSAAPPDGKATVLPALLSGGRVLRRGEAVVADVRQTPVGNTGITGASSDDLGGDQRGGQFQ